MPEHEEIGRLVEEISHALDLKESSTRILERQHKALKYVLENWEGIVDRRLSTDNWPDTDAIETHITQLQEASRRIDQNKRRLAQLNVKLP